MSEEPPATPGSPEDAPSSPATSSPAPSSSANAADTAPLEPWRLLDDGQPVEEVDALIIGCGNVLRGDDAAGPVLVRRMWERDFLGRVRAQRPELQIRIWDGGTSGMDVSFAMRGAKTVIIVDAARDSGQPAGTIFRVPGEEIAALPPVAGINTHEFRWDHSLAFSRWLLGPYCPQDVTVYLVAAHSLELGGVLSPQVDAALERLEGIIFDQVTALGGTDA